jgi:hypothetical protein
MTIGLTRASIETPTEKIIYRYIPRTFEEEQNEPVMISDIFKTMFSQPEPWIGNINDVDTRKKEAINKYYISQL